MEDSAILNTTTYLEALTQGNGLSEIENLILHGLELIHVGKGIGEDGTWHAGVITAVMDAIGACSVYSTGEGLHSSVDLNASFYSMAKIHVRILYPFVSHEKVEVEARVKGTNGRLKSSVIEIRRERDGELIATGRLWMAPLSVKVKHIGSSNLSKL
ncbi:hypothetical protein Bca101_062610 [Brassica carinata]